MAGIRKSQEAEALWREAGALREKLFERSPSGFNAASFLNNQALMRKAYDLWRDPTKDYPEYAKYRGKAE